MAERKKRKAFHKIDCLEPDWWAMLKESVAIEFNRPSRPSRFSEDVKNFTEYNPRMELGGNRRPQGPTRDSSVEFWAR